MNNQRNYPRVAAAIRQKEEGLKKQFEEAGFTWPAKQLYLRSFKYDSQMEVWVRNSSQEQFRLLKTYKVCALSGSLGPKRMEGDYQVPEGFYYINELNPNSRYHLSLGLNYPNMADRAHSDPSNPGGEIFIHGSCSTIGCIPIQNDQVEELYILSAYALEQGQQFIPVHIFPVRFNNQKNSVVLKKAIDGTPGYQELVDGLKEAFDYFETNRKLPLISINRKGQYTILSR
ncbi:MAG TPA: L,D-transpeptidase family protein [Sediminibacterium sp.]|nr:L,D-transpeptidase family protein [Sediminibacterium sp.]